MHSSSRLEASLRKSVIPGYLFITVVTQGRPRLLPMHQVVRKSYCLHAARGYLVKLQRQEYTERHTTENNNNNNI